MYWHRFSRLVRMQDCMTIYHFGTTWLVVNKFPVRSWGVTGWSPAVGCSIRVALWPCSFSQQPGSSQAGSLTPLCIPFTKPNSIALFFSDPTAFSSSFKHPFESSSPLLSPLFPLRLHDLLTVLFFSARTSLQSPLYGIHTCDHLNSFQAGTWHKSLQLLSQIWFTIFNLYSALRPFLFFFFF